MRRNWDRELPARVPCGSGIVCHKPASRQHNHPGQNRQPGNARQAPVYKQVGKKTAERNAQRMLHLIYRPGLCSPKCEWRIYYDSRNNPASYELKDFGSGYAARNSRCVSEICRCVADWVCSRLIQREKSLCSVRCRSIAPYASLPNRAFPARQALANVGPFIVICSEISTFQLH